MPVQFMGIVGTTYGTNSKKDKLEILMPGIATTGNCILAGARSYQNAEEINELEQGLFTHYFIEGINNGKAVCWGQEYITVIDIFRYIREMISKDYPGIYQDPICDYHGVDGELYIAKNPKYPKYLKAKEFFLKTELILSKNI